MIASFAQDIYEMLCKKHPNKKIYVIADHHFFHKNIIDYTRKNFSNVIEMNEYIIASHNKVVKKEDIVIFLGDFCFKKDFIKDILNQMNGYKYLIIGNHDLENIIKLYPIFGFEAVFSTPIKIKNAYLSHEPLLKNDNDNLQVQMITKEFLNTPKAINYHGHIHDDIFISEKHKNVSCESLNYEPLMIGYTKELNIENKAPLFINSPYFDEALNYLKEKYNFDPQLIISDYIYSYILESLSKYEASYYCQGSFGLLKKFDYQTKFSDLDISMFYNPNISKSKNYSLLKKMIDDAFESLKEINGINLSYFKRYFSIRIFDILFTSKHPYFSHCTLDANLIPLDYSNSNDFIKLQEQTILEKYIKKNSLILDDDYKFPIYNANFLSPEVDIANLSLQVLFQCGNPEKKLLTLKKLKYVYKHYSDNKNIKNLSSIFTRYFLRNIYFFYTMKRFREIEYIQNTPYSLEIFSSLPLTIQNQMHEILSNPNSCFFSIFNEICATPTQNIGGKCLDIIKKVK